MALTRVQVENFKRLQDQFKTLEKEYKKAKESLINSLLEKNSNFAHIDISNRQVINTSRLKADGLYDNYSMFTEVKKLVLDI